MDRRNFFKGVCALSALGTLNSLPVSCISEPSQKIKITNTASAVEKEPLIQPLGFKGGYLTELWQSIVQVTGSSGQSAIGLGTQSVLWSDGNVFENNTETDGNSMMFAITQRALKIIEGQGYDDPVSHLEDLFGEVFEYGKKVTSNPDLRKTFALNALVPIDNALWLLYAYENGITSFEEMIPEKYRSTFSEQHKRIAAIPLISYGTTPSQMKETVEDGYFFMKIKIGEAGTQKEMLEKDMERLTLIHNTLKNVRTPHTQNGKLPYYFDANGRYKSKELFFRFLDHAEKLGALNQIVIIEEPFPEDMELDVSDIPVRLASDESAHTDVDTIKRIQMGYRAVALKPIAKTLSMTMKIAKVATDNNIPCFCADLTVNPILVEWNKNVAARLKSFPGLDHLGLLESNGHQNYKRWNEMLDYLPDKNKSWVKINNGLYLTGKEFFCEDGGIFQESVHYKNLFI